MPLLNEDIIMTMIEITIPELMEARKPENIDIKILELENDIKKQQQKCKEIALDIKKISYLSKELNEKNNFIIKTSFGQFNFNNEFFNETMEAYKTPLFLTNIAMTSNVFFWYYLTKIKKNTKNTRNSVSSRVEEVVDSVKINTSKKLKSSSSLPNKHNPSKHKTGKKYFKSSSLGGSKIRRSKIRRTKKMKGGVKIDFLLIFISLIITFTSLLCVDSSSSSELIRTDKKFNPGNKSMDTTALLELAASGFKDYQVFIPHNLSDIDIHQPPEGPKRVSKFANIGLMNTTDGKPQFKNMKIGKVAKKVQKIDQTNLQFILELLGSKTQNQMDIKKHAYNMHVLENAEAEIKILLSTIYKSFQDKCRDDLFAISQDWIILDNLFIGIDDRFHTENQEVWKKNMNDLKDAWIKRDLEYKNAELIGVKDVKNQQLQLGDNMQRLVKSELLPKDVILESPSIIPYLSSNANPNMKVNTEMVKSAKDTVQSIEQGIANFTYNFDKNINPILLKKENERLEQLIKTKFANNNVLPIIDDVINDICMMPSIDVIYHEYTVSISIPLLNTNKFQNIIEKLRSTIRIVDESLEKKWLTGHQSQKVRDIIPKFVSIQEIASEINRDVETIRIIDSIEGFNATIATSLELLKMLSLRTFTPAGTEAWGELKKNKDKLDAAIVELVGKTNELDAQKVNLQGSEVTSQVAQITNALRTAYIRDIRDTLGSLRNDMVKLSDEFFIGWIYTVLFALWRHGFLIIGILMAVYCGLPLSYAGLKILGKICSVTTFVIHRPFEWADDWKNAYKHTIELEKRRLAAQQRQELQQLQLPPPPSRIQELEQANILLRQQLAAAQQAAPPPPVAAQQLAAQPVAAQSVAAQLQLPQPPPVAAQPVASP